MPIIRQIAQLGHEVLRSKAVTLNQETIKLASTQQLIDDMLATIKDANGVGMAAPQIYESLQIFIMASCPNMRYPSAPYMDPIAIINPKVIEHSDEIEKNWEGCLSVPGIRGFVPRYKRIKIGYFTRDIQPRQQVLEDFVARIFQHEYDHLHGISFLDRLETTKDIITEKEFIKRCIKF
ncbi:MAG: peptide deformylase [Thiomargarita sp.]|nr:peptide deformylase [Thiomargarita sp.]